MTTQSHGLLSGSLTAKFPSLQVGIARSSPLLRMLCRLHEVQPLNRAVGKE